MKKKFKNYLLLLFFIALTLNIPSVMAKWEGEKYTEGWVEKTWYEEIYQKEFTTVNIDKIYLYDKNGNKTDNLLIDCSGFKETGFSHGYGYTDRTDTINYGLCKIAEYDTNIPDDKYSSKAKNAPDSFTKITVEIIDKNGKHYDEYYNKSTTACDAILTAKTKNTDGYTCSTIDFEHNGKFLPLGKYTIRKTYEYSGGITDGNIPVTRTIESTFEVAEYQSFDAKGFIIEAYDSGTNKLIKDRPVTYFYSLYKNVYDTDPIDICYNNVKECYTYSEGCPYEEANTVCLESRPYPAVESSKIDAKGINPAMLSSYLNAKKICLSAFVQIDGRTVGEGTQFCLNYVEEFGSDYRFEISNFNSGVGSNANVDRVKAIGKKKIQDYPESYEQYKNLEGMVSTISYSTFQINIPYTGDGSNNGDSGNGGNSGTDSGNQGNNTSSNAGTINIEFSNIKNSVKGLEYKLCTTKDCSEQVIFSSADIKASISNLEFDKKYYLVISKVPSNYAMPQDNVKEITLTKDNTSFSVVFKLSEKANVPNTLANRPMIIVFISILALAGGGYLIYRSMKSQKLN